VKIARATVSDQVNSEPLPANPVFLVGSADLDIMSF
jgi:hypothetical protein